MAKKQSNFDFHLTWLKDLKNISSKIKSIIGDCPEGSCYDRDPGRGWWMAIKEIVIMRYMILYLKIIRKRLPRCRICFIDLLSSSGMIKLSDNHGHTFNFAGSSMLAAGISLMGENMGFDKIYSNDGDPEKRRYLKLWLEKIRSKVIDNGNSPYEIMVDESNEVINSNDFIDRIIEDMKEYGNQTHYLALIDNEGMDIPFETISKLRSWEGQYCKGEYGDIIINYPNYSIQRHRDSSKVEPFFGRKMAEVPSRKWMGSYFNQLKSIGMENIETLQVKAGDIGFYYTMLFCVRRINSNAPWLGLIEKYRDDRFKDFDGRNVKLMWDVVNKRQKTLFG